MKNCYECNRTFVDKVKDKLKECVCHRWLMGDHDNAHKYDALRFLCVECYHEQIRTERIKNRAKLELTPKKPKVKRKEKK